MVPSAVPSGLNPRNHQDRFLCFWNSKHTSYHWNFKKKMLTLSTQVCRQHSDDALLTDCESQKNGKGVWNQGNINSMNPR